MENVADEGNVTEHISQTVVTSTEYVASSGAEDINVELGWALVVQLISASSRVFFSLCALVKYVLIYFIYLFAYLY